MNTSICTGFPGAANGKEPVCQCSRLRDLGSVLRSRTSTGGGHGNPQPTPVFWLGESHGQRNLAIVRRITESKTTEAT